MRSPNRLVVPVALVAALATTAVTSGSQEEQEQQEGARAEAAGQDARPALEVRYLANEGFLLRVGARAVLVDAFVRTPYAGYPALTPDLAEKLDAAEVPFRAIALALTSHVHADHFQAGAALPFLERSSRTQFATSPQVLDALLELEVDEDLGERLLAFLPEPGEVLELTHEEIGVEFRRVAHGGDQAGRIQNLVHVVEIDGFRVAHLGDAVVRDQAFDGFDLQDLSLDVALVPYWFFLDEGGRSLVREHLGARHYVAMHFPAEGLDDLTEALRRAQPDLVVFEEPLELRTFERAK